MERQSFLQDDDWRLLLVYRSEYCKETFQTLKYNFSLDDFIILEEHIHIMDAMSEEAHKEAENKR